MFFLFKLISQFSYYEEDEEENCNEDYYYYKLLFSSIQSIFNTGIKELTAYFLIFLSELESNLIKDDRRRGSYSLPYEIIFSLSFFISNDSISLFYLFPINEMNCLDQSFKYFFFNLLKFELELLNYLSLLSAFIFKSSLIKVLFDYEFINFDNKD